LIASIIIIHTALPSIDFWLERIGQSSWILWFVAFAFLSLLRSAPLPYAASHDAMVRVYDEAGNVIETHEHAGELKEW
jgi:hypothetical protein